MIDINKLCEVSISIDKEYPYVESIQLYKNGYKVIPLHNDEQPRCDDKWYFIDFNGNILAEWVMDCLNVMEGFPLKNIIVPVKFRPPSWKPEEGWDDVE